MFPSKIFSVCSRNIRDFWVRIDPAGLSELILVDEFSLFTAYSLPLPPFRQTLSNNSNKISNNVPDPEVHVTHRRSRRTTRRPRALHTNQTSPNNARVSRLRYPSGPRYAHDSYQEKKSSSIWDYIKSWSFFASSKNTASEVPEPTPEPSSPTNPPPSLRDIITRHNRTASPNLRETQEAIVAMQAKATKNLYERGLEVSVQPFADRQTYALYSCNANTSRCYKKSPLLPQHHRPNLLRKRSRKYIICLSITDPEPKSGLLQILPTILAKHRTRSSQII